MGKESISDIVNTRYKNFLSFNIRKLFQVINNLEPCTRELFHVIPFLINSNTKQYPGYIDGFSASFGIYGYQVEPDVLPVIERLFGKAVERVKKNGDPSGNACTVQSLFLMGSLGSIGQTDRSDFDYWVVIDDSITYGQAQAVLQKKLLLIEQWCLEHENLEVHFFIITLDRIKRNDFEKVDRDSAGSALSNLLKDEFYRSSILISGRIPYFWITPDGCSDSSYDAYIKRIKEESSCIPSRFIDMGNLCNIDKNEYYGALLWQMAKGLHSPYKSVIKMALIHYYFFLSGPNFLLSNEIKRRIHSKSIQDSDIDPYLLMFDRVCSFYEERDNKKALDILKKSFILKIESNLKKEDLGKDVSYEYDMENYKKRIVERYLIKWNWTYSAYDSFKSEKTLSFENNILLGKQINTFMMDVYKTVSSELKQTPYITNRITGDDLTILAKKVISQLSPKRYKMPKLSFCNRAGAVLRHITLAENIEENRTVWRLFYNRIDQKDILMQDFAKNLLYSSHSILGLIAYLVYNRIIDKKTDVAIYDKRHNIDRDIVVSLLMKLYIFFFSPLSIVFEKNLLEREYIYKCFYVVNLFYPPADAEQYRHIGVIYQNSMGEIFLREFSGSDALTESLKCITEAIPPKINNFSDYFQVYSGKGRFSYIQKIDITNRINKIIVEKIGERRVGSRSKLDYDGREEYKIKRQPTYNTLK